MTVRAKFKVQRIESTIGSKVVGKNEQGRDTYEPCELRTIVMQPVYGNGDPEHENTKFWQASPSGEIRLGTISPAAWEQFELGGEFYIDFTRAA
jgi:hypothetical protein